MKKLIGVALAVVMFALSSFASAALVAPNQDIVIESWIGDSNSGSASFRVNTDGTLEKQPYGYPWQAAGNWYEGTCDLGPALCSPTYASHVSLRVIPYENQHSECSITNANGGVGGSVFLNSAWSFTVGVFMDGPETDCSYLVTYFLNDNLEAVVGQNLVTFKFKSGYQPALWRPFGYNSITPAATAYDTPEAACRDANYAAYATSPSQGWSAFLNSSTDNAGGVWYQRSCNYVAYFPGTTIQWFSGTAHWVAQNYCAPNQRITMVTVANTQRFACVPL